MATILDEQKSTGGSPYAFYTVTANVSDRTLYGITVSGNIATHLQSSSSSLGTGGTMGLNAYITLNGVEYGPVELKSTSTSWSGTTTHNSSYSFTVSNLIVLQTSMSAKFRVSRTGSAEGNYSKGAALQLTNCDNITFSQAQAQSVFNSVSSSSTNANFNINATQYGLYDSLVIKNGGTTIKTIDGIVAGTAYNFTIAEQNTLNALFGATTTSINLTATLTTYTNSSKTTSLGSTDKTMTLTLPSYTPSITLSSYSDNISTYNTYKLANTDIIKTLSKPNITITMSNNYNNTYSAATCNGTSGTISGRTITFTNLAQANTYTINVTDSRNKISSVVLSGNSYTDTIKTVQWYKGNVNASVVRTSPTGSTATVKVSLTVYNGANLHNLLTEDFDFKYTQSGGSEVVVHKSSFTYSSGEYTYTISGLDYTKSVAWNVSGTDKIGVALNNNSGTLSVGLPVWNAYRKDNENIFRVNGKSKASEFNGNLVGNASTATNATNDSDGKLFQRYYSHAETPSPSSFDDVGASGALYRSGLYSVYIGSTWYNLVNVRHRNGQGDGNNYGLQIRKKFSSTISPIEYRSQSGGTWSAWSSLQIAPVTLYDNSAGSTGTITLNETSANFQYLEIFFKNDGGAYSSTKVYSPNGKNATLFVSYTSSGTTWIQTANKTINGTSITTGDTSERNLNTNSGNTGNYIYITRVIGYR